MKYYACKISYWNDFAEEPSVCTIIIGAEDYAGAAHFCTERFHYVNALHIQELEDTMIELTDEMLASILNYTEQELKI